MFYLALFQSILAYGIIGWGGLYYNNLKRLFSLQKYTLIVIFKKTYIYPTIHLFKESQILPIGFLYFKTIVIFCKKFPSLLPKIHHPQNTRTNTNNMLQTVRYNLSLTQRQTIYIAPKILIF